MPIKIRLLWYCVARIILVFKPCGRGSSCFAAAQSLVVVSQLIIQLCDTTLLAIKVMPWPVFLSSTAKS